jgi:exodeoxyribonuclease III
MLLISWNVNGIRAALTKGMADFVSAENPDVLCLQETKAREEQVELPLEFSGYKRYWNSAQKPGYSGTAIFSKTAPLSIEYGIRHDHHDNEGRVISAEFAEFSLVTVYTPNSQDELRRLDYRVQWDADFLAFVKQLEAEKHKPVIFCGDLNVSHEEIDLARPRENRRNPGFTDEERQGFSNMLDAGFTDTFRHLYPDQRDAYSWWSYRGGARERNVGWRLDYFLTSHTLRDRIAAADILPHIHGSDHCPVSLRLS